MKKKLKIKKGDKVQVITGDDKGLSGSVLDIDLENLKIRVQGARIQTKREKKENKLIKEEGWMDYSNVREDRSSKKPKKKSNPSAQKSA